MQAWRNVTEAYRRVYDSLNLQAECQEPGSALEPYTRYTSMGYLYLYFLSDTKNFHTTCYTAIVATGRTIAYFFLVPIFYPGPAEIPYECAPSCEGSRCQLMRGTLMPHET